MGTPERIASAGRRGSALVMSIAFITMFSALAVAMATFSTANIQIAENHRKAGVTRACAESGLEVIRYWMSTIAIPGTTESSERFAGVVSALQDEITDANATNLTLVSSESTASFSNVPLDSARGQSFTATLTKIDNDTIQLDVIGQYGQFSRTLRSHYNFAERADTVFDFGVASKGPVSLTGNIELTGITIDVESNAYIESEDNLLALSIIGNSQIAGQVKIVNPSAYVYLQGGHAGIGGATGEEATQQPYTTIGVPPADFPDMDTTQFAGLVELTTLDPSMDTTADATLENVLIPAGMNPTFSGHATITGLVWIETPNVVTFTGNSDVCAIIVGDGDPTDNSATNQLSFQGDVSSTPVTELPAFADADGTFIMAPGFFVSFGGSFDALNGAIAANGIEFFGNAGGTINGSIINYSTEQMSLSGNSDLYFNRSGLSEVPAGFAPEIILQYDTSSYSEVI